MIGALLRPRRSAGRLELFAAHWLGAAQREPGFKMQFDCSDNDVMRAASMGCLLSTQNEGHIGLVISITYHQYVNQLAGRQQGTHL